MRDVRHQRRADLFAISPNGLKSIATWKTPSHPR